MFLKILYENGFIKEEELTLIRLCNLIDDYNYLLMLKEKEKENDESKKIDFCNEVEKNSLEENLCDDLNYYGSVYTLNSSSS